MTFDIFKTQSPTLFEEEPIKTFADITENIKHPYELTDDDVQLIMDYHSSNVSTDMRVLTVHNDGSVSVSDGKTDYSPEYIDLAKKFNSLMSFNEDKLRKCQII